MTFGSLFSGIGGMDLGLERAGMECRWQVEIDPFCQKVLAKHWPHVKRHDDVRTVEIYIEETSERINRLGSVDMVAGGFPCQDISNAGNGAGIVGSRSGLWQEFARILAEIRPKFAFIENVTALRTKGLALVLQDLVALGFDAEWHCVPASAIGANHERDRIWIFAYPAGLFREAVVWGEPYRDVQAVREDANPSSDGWGSRRSRRLDTSYSWQQEQAFSNANIDSPRELQPKGYFSTSGRRVGYRASEGYDADTYSEPLVRAAIARGERHAWTVEPGVVRMVHGIPNRVDRLKGLGNAVVPQVAEWLGRRIIEAHQESA